MTKLYAVPGKKDNIDWQDGLGRPYGIVSADSRETVWPLSDRDQAGRDWINYPKERENIENVYPGFTEWLQGGASPNFDSPKEDLSINAIGFIKPAPGGVSAPLTDNFRALYDIEGCLRSLNLSNESTNAWNNGNPMDSNIPSTNKP